MGGAVLSFSLMAVAVRELARTLGSFEILFLRSIVSLAIVLAIVPIDFLRLPLIAAVGLLFYGEPIELPTLLGAAVIFAGTYYSIRRESRSPPPSPPVH